MEFSRSSSPSFSLVKLASKRFGNTITSSLWRLVESLDVPALGIVSQHPHYPDEDFDPVDPCRYFIRSRLFEQQYSGLTERECFKIVRSYCSWRKRGPLGNDEIVLRDDRGEEHVFLFEAFHNGHALLTLITYLRPQTISIAASADP